MPQIKDTVLQLFGKALRGDRDGVVQEPLPRRWVDLIRHLDEQERKRTKPLEAEAEASTRGYVSTQHQTYASTPTEDT